MSDEFDPIHVPEPVIPEPYPIEISPGQDPERNPLEPDPRYQPLTPSDPPPPPPKDVEPQPLGGGTGKPPSSPKLTSASSSPDDRGGKGGPLQEPSCKFLPVDDVSQYNSFRNGSKYSRSSGPFGIVVSLKGYGCYVKTLRQQMPGFSEAEYREAAWRFIVDHQIHHFLIDRAVSTLEGTFMVAGKNLPHDIWHSFHYDHARSPQGYSTLEESSCCAYSLRSVTGRLRELALALTHLQPDGYRQQTEDGKQILAKHSPLTHQQATSTLLSTYLNRAGSRRAVGLHGLMLYGSHTTGTKGDTFISDPHTGKKRAIPIYLAK